MDMKPKIGMRFCSESDAYETYNNYGGVVGFGIRRDCAHRDKEDSTIITSRRFLCNKAGTRVIDKRDMHIIKPRAETRTGCLARMCISRLSNGEYVCRDFSDDHNHELHTAPTRHFMRSQRKITDLQELEIDMAYKSGIKPKTAFDYMGTQAGGPENLGYTKTDLRNYLRTKRERSLAKGEAGALSDYFQKQSRRNPSFTFCMQYDTEEMITNIFWADPRMLIDYQLFGDVVIFDTTFCTNKQNRPLAIFAGFNHHRGATIFGAALLYDETTESFKWLFETFLEANGQKKPKTIFTDQDVAMGNAIAEVMPETWHGLCTWHLMQNGISKLGNLMRGGSSFLKNFRRCMYGIEDETEFEMAWQQLITDNQLETNTWLTRIYSVKKKWARCYMKYTFTGGVRSTQLSESINSDLKQYLRPSIDFGQFFTQFERVVEDKRANELKAEFEARNTLPRSLGFKSPILRQAGKVYTPFIYERFLHEFQWVLNCSLKFRFESDFGFQYVVGVVDEEGNLMEQDYRVKVLSLGPLIACSCRLFETDGILCRHALKILHVLDLNSIPETYILPRWTRAARSMVVEDIREVQVNEDVEWDCKQRFQFVWPHFLKLSTQACTSKQGYELAKDSIVDLRRKLAGVVIDDPITEAPVQSVPEDVNLVLKKKERHKGSSKRHKGCIETQRKGKKKVSNDNQGQHPVNVETPHVHSQGMLPGNFMQGCQNTLDYTNFSGLLQGLQSSQASLPTPNFFSHHTYSQFF